MPRPQYYTFNDEDANRFSYFSVCIDLRMDKPIQPAFSDTSNNVKNGSNSTIPNFN